MKARLAAAAAVLAALFAASACSPPKYVPYASIHGDFKCSVPWGWNVITDDDGLESTSTMFLGPFEPDFFLGMPSLTVRWYTNGVPRRLRDGGVEVYRGPDDYIKQMLDGVYGKDREMEQDVHEIVLSGQRRAKHFVVLSGVEAPAGARWGISRDPKTGKRYNVRQHAYVVVPMSRGFYVLIYPATRDGFELYHPQFNEFVNSFVVLTEGPKGPPAAPAAAFAAKGKP